MADLALPVTVALHQLQIPVLAAGPLDLGLLDEHVATTLPALSDGKTTKPGPQLPQHNPPRTTNKPAQTPTPTHDPPELPILNRGKWG